MASGSIFDHSPKARWPRSQKFTLSERGREAEGDYRQRIEAARDGEGRTSFDVARTAWSQAYRLQVDDGIYLAELRAQPATMAQLIAALESCGKSRSDALAAIARLVDGGFVTAAPA